jgi:hypothetical protein
MKIVDECKNIPEANFSPAGEGVGSPGGSWSTPPLKVNAILVQSSFFPTVELPYKL